MRGVKGEFKSLDFAFRHETHQAQSVKNFIAASYAAAAPDCHTLAEHRYRNGEHRFATCRNMHISESQYYKLLGKFLQTAKALHENFLLKCGK